MKLLKKTQKAILQVEKFPNFFSIFKSDINSQDSNEISESEFENNSNTIIVDCTISPGIMTKPHF